MRDDVTLPAAGGFSTSARPDVASAQRSTGAAVARAIAPRNVSVLGGGASFFSGATAEHHAVLVGDQASCASADTSSAVTVGT